jgi:large subunit ribosomal protein L18
MATGPKYRVQFRRRREQKTNYHRRLRLIKSRETRLVIRASTQHVVVQFMEAKIQGDKVLAHAFSKELVQKYGWKAGTGNQPAAYLTGYLAGLKAKKAGIEAAILDLGIFVHTNRVYAAFKGVLDAGINVPHDEKIFPEQFVSRLNGSHLEAFGNALSEKIAEEAAALKLTEANRKELEKKLTKTKDEDEQKQLQQQLDEMKIPELHAQTVYDKNFQAYRASKFDITTFTSHFDAVKSSIEKKIE